MRAGRLRVASLAAAALVLTSLAGMLADTETAIAFRNFGRVPLFGSAATATHVVMLWSDLGGFDARARTLARATAAEDALVVGLDTRHWWRAQERGTWDACYPSADLEVLSQFLQKRLDVPTYLPPILAGDGAGGVLAYATLAQSHPNTYRGAVSLGFCPDVRFPKRLGAAERLAWVARAADPADDAYRLLPPADLGAPWLVRTPADDEPCADATRAFVGAVPGAAFVAPDAPAAALLAAAVGRIDTTMPHEPHAHASGVEDLPLVEVLATGTPRDLVAIILTGDGGWASIDRSIGRALAADGIRVVGFDSLQYFWKRRTPDGAAEDLGRALRHYLAGSTTTRAVLVGYSRGADVLPFLVARLPDDLRARVALVALTAPALDVDFEFHLTDWIGGGHHDALPILPEMAKLGGVRVLCLYGADERDESLCPRLPEGSAAIVALPGGHHFDGGYEALAARILAEIAAPASPPHAPPLP